MIQLKEGEVEKIISCDDPQSVKYVIVETIITLRQEGLIHDIIMHYIQELDLSLTLYKANGLSVKEAENLRSARQILMNKILNGIDA